MAQNDDFLKWTEPVNPEWITALIDDNAVKWAKSFGIYLAEGFKRKPDDPFEKINKKNPDGTNIMKEGKEVFETQPPLSTSQLRKFFGEIRRIQADLQLKDTFNKEDLILIKPKLAYQVGREKGKDARISKIRDFYFQLSICIDSVQNKEHFKRFVKLVEAIVAYHKEAEMLNSNDTQNEE